MTEDLPDIPSVIMAAESILSDLNEIDDLDRVKKRALAENLINIVDVVITILKQIAVFGYKFDIMNRAIEHVGTLVSEVIEDDHEIDEKPDIGDMMVV